MARSNKKRTSPQTVASATTGRTSGRHRTQTKRLQEATSNTNEENARRTAAKEDRLERERERHQREERDAAVEREGDSADVIRLKGWCTCQIYM